MPVPLNALKKAPILNEAGVALAATKYSAVSSNPAAVAIVTSSGNLFAQGIAAGTATVTATRLLDGATATLDIEVFAAVPFTISLGIEVAA